MTGLAAAVQGDGPTVLFLHGIGSSSSAFDAQLEAFRHEYRCLAPDAPGYRSSDDPPPPTGDPMDMFAAAYEDLLDDLVGDAPVVIVGVSFGGVVATRMALRGRAYIVGLVLCDTSRGSGVDPKRAAAMRARADDLAALGAAEFARRRSPRLVHTHDSTVVAAVASTMAEAIRLPGYAYAADAMASTDHTAQLGDIDVATLVVVGEHDQVCPPTESAVIAESIPGAELVTIADAGHLANVEQPDAFNAAIAPFLQRVHPARQHQGAPMTTTINLEELIDGCIAARDTRAEDWDTLAFQAKAGDEFRRAQIRYIGSGATGDHDSDGRIIPASHFTFSNMRLPAGAVGPEHNHHDVEEVFFVLEGELDVTVHDPDDGTRTATRRLGYRDLVCVPPGVPRSLRNVGDTDALFCVILGAPKPQLPTYPPTSPMAGITRD